MSSAGHFPSVRRANLALAAGGLLMAVFWIIFTTVHGPPTSFDQTRVVLGRSTFFWGSLLSIPPGLLVALGLILLYQPLARSGRLLAKSGYALTLIGFIVPAGMDLFIWGALGPPLFVPVVGIGLILLAAGNWHNPKLHRQSLYLLVLVGMIQLLAFALALIPLEVSDQFGGYRVFGFLAHFATGIGWIILGTRFWKAQMQMVVDPAQN